MFPPFFFFQQIFLLNSVSQHERSLFSHSFHIHHLISQVAFPDICPRIFYCVVVGGEVYCGGRQPGGSGWWSRIGEGLMWLKVRRAFQSDPQYRSVAWLCVFRVCIFSYDGKDMVCVYKREFLLDLLNVLFHMWGFYILSHFKVFYWNKYKLVF